MGWLNKYKEVIPKAQDGKVLKFETPEGEIAGVDITSQAYEELRPQLSMKMDDDNYHAGELPTLTLSKYDQQYPYYHTLDEQSKEYFNDDGPIGRAIRAKALDGVGFNADKALAIPGQLLQGAGSAMQVPQSAMVEGIQAIRGKEYDFKSALPGGEQRRPSQFLGYENPEGFWQHAENFTIDAFTDPLNALGAGIIGRNAIGRATNQINQNIGRTADRLVNNNPNTFKDFIFNKALLREQIEKTNQSVKLYDDINHAEIAKYDAFYKIERIPFYKNIRQEMYDMRNHLNTKTAERSRRNKVINDYDLKIDGDDALTYSTTSPIKGLSTGNKELIDFNTGSKINAKVNLPGDNKKISLKNNEVTFNDIKGESELYMSPEYRQVMRDNINYIEQNFPGTKVFGSSRGVSEAGLPHLSNDYDVMISRANYDKNVIGKAKHLGNNGQAQLHSIGEEFGKQGEVDFNIVESNAKGLATGRLAQELYKQAFPAEYHERARQLVQGKKLDDVAIKEMEIPYTPDELIENIDPTIKSIVDMYESTKDKHINKIDAYIAYGEPHKVQAAQQKFVQTLVGERGSIGHIFPKNQLSNPEENVKILKMMGYHGDIKAISKSPDRMQSALNDYYINNTIYSRSVSENPDEAMKAWKPEKSSGGNALGAGLNFVKLGDSRHWGMVYGHRQFGIKTNNNSPEDYIKSIGKSTNASYPFSAEEKEILDGIIKKYGIEDELREYPERIVNMKQLIHNISSSDKVSEALNEFGNLTGRRVAVTDNTYGNSMYASGISHFDENLDLIEYALKEHATFPNSLHNRHENAKNVPELESMKVSAGKFKSIQNFLKTGEKVMQERIDRLDSQIKTIDKQLENVENKHTLKETEKINELQKRYDELNEQRNEINDRLNRAYDLGNKAVKVFVGTMAAIPIGGIGYASITGKENREARKQRREELKRNLENDTINNEKQLEEQLPEFKNGGWLKKYQKGGNVPDERINMRMSKDNIPVIQERVMDVPVKMASVEELNAAKEDMYGPSPTGITSDILMRQAYKESTFNPKAVSPAGYKGLTQIGEAVITDFNKAVDKNRKIDPFNPKDAIDVQKYSMNELYNASFNKHPQDDKVRVAKTLAAYNWGRGNLVKFLNKKKKSGVDIYDSMDWIKDLPNETRDYIQKILLDEDETFRNDFNSAIESPNNKQFVELYKEMKNGGWLKKYQDGDNIPATRQDSLDLYNNSMKLENYYKNYKRSDSSIPNNPHLLNDEHVTKFYGEQPIVRVPDGETYKFVKPEELEYRIDINKYKYKQRELASGILDTRAPMQLFDRRIHPTFVSDYENINEQDPLKGDRITLFNYHPLTVKPYDMLSEEEKWKRVKKYGYDGFPKSVEGKYGIQQNQEPNLDTDLVAYLQSENKPHSYAERKKLYEEITGNKDYKGTPEQNIGLLQTIKGGGEKSFEEAFPEMFENSDGDFTDLTPINRNSSSSKIGEIVPNEKGYAPEIRGKVKTKQIVEGSLVNMVKDKKGNITHFIFQTPDGKRQKVEKQPNAYIDEGGYSIYQKQEPEIPQGRTQYGYRDKTGAFKRFDLTQDSKSKKAFEQAKSQPGFRIINQENLTSQSGYNPNQLALGGYLNQFQNGGGLNDGKKKPLYVDPNDPAGRERYQAYQDSLGLYNYSNKLIREGLGYKSFSFPENPKLYEDYNIPYNPTGTSLNINNKAYPIGTGPDHNGYRGINYRKIVEESLKTKNKPLGWTYSDASIPVYKKPVERVEYKPNPEIVAKQQQLIDAGYNIGKADGIWGKKSKAAYEQLNKKEESSSKVSEQSQVPIPNRHFQYSYYDDSGKMVRRDFKNNEKGRKEFEAAKKRPGFNVTNPDNLTKQSGYAPSEDRFNYVPGMKKGGIIKDNRGQWAHPGEITEINSPYITMKGVPYPVLGISDTGDTQMMYPEEEYEFVGNKVTEYPLALNGININKQSKNWLDKYNNEDVYGEQEIEKAQDGTVQKIKTKLNPKNWGVKDYTDKYDTWDEAYAAAKKAGETEIMWNKGPNPGRKNLDYAGTPRQEVGSYGVKGNKVVDPDLPIQVNRYSPSKNYPPGHISAGYVGRQPSKIPKTSVNKTMTGKTRKYDDIPDQSLYIYSRNSLNPENVKPGYNFVTNNCADAVCDALSLNDRSLIETPRGVVKKLLSGEQYPSLDVTGRTYGNYYRKLFYENNILDNSKYWLGIASSPDNKRLSLEIIEKIQQSLKKEGYDLPNSIKSDGYFDGVLGEETKAALKDYQTKSKKSSNKKKWW
jgi:hypothetical protein